jgi:hypothetical protein
MRPGRHLLMVVCATLAVALPVDAAVAPPTATWTPASPGPALYFEGTGFAASTCSVVAFGGADAVSGTNRSTWIYDPGDDAWSAVPPARRGTPAPRAHPRLAWDPVRARLVMFGGLGASRGAAGRGELADTWAFDPSAGTWSPLVTKCRKGGLCPPARHAHGMVWSSVLQRILVFGGISGDTARNDLWAFDGTAWTRLHATGAPSPRQYFGMAEDAATGQVVVLGGVGAGYEALSDTWILDPATLAWREARGTAVPAPSNGVGMAWVPAIGAVVATGGATAGDCTTGAEGAWAFDIAAEAWVPITTQGGPPAPRVSAHLVGDTCRGSAVFLGLPGNSIVPLPAETDYTWILE